MEEPLRLIQCVFAFCLLIFAFSSSALTVTTLNLEWFGRGGEMHGTPQEEFRHPTIKELLETYLQTTDVFVFQEIIDVTSLFSILAGWDCRTYDIQDLNHQHITTCARPGLISRDSVIDAVQVSWGLRPGFRVDLTLTNRKTLAVIGVHLKAGQNDSAVRVKQIEKLMETVEPGTPMLILGDFNTFPKSKTGLSEDDIAMMKPIFSAQDFTEAGGDQATYLGYDRRTFDRVWSRNLKVLSHAVRGPCQAYGVEPSTRFTLESFYTQFISDHCPVSVEIEE